MVWHGIIFYTILQYDVGAIHSAIAMQGIHQYAIVYHIRAWYSITIVDFALAGYNKRHGIVDMAWYIMV